jgi:hypothetical protein
MHKKQPYEIQRQMQDTHQLIIKAWVACNLWTRNVSAVAANERPFKNAFNDVNYEAAGEALSEKSIKTT